MKVVPFSLFSPAGNDTLFLDAESVEPPYCGDVCKKALGLIPAEQAAVTNLKNKSLRMAGGEFCVNACRAFGALLSWSGNLDPSGQCLVSISGHNVHLSVRGHAPIWEVTAKLSPQITGIIKAEKDILLVHLQGISHLLIKCPQLPDREFARLHAKKLAAKYHLFDQPAYGVTWWTGKGTEYEILPFVEVPMAGTANFENSCGSASMALYVGAQLSRDRIEILQPHGSSLAIYPGEGKEICVAGPVTILVAGNLWLEDA